MLSFKLRVFVHMAGLFRCYKLCTSLNKCSAAISLISRHKNFTTYISSEKSKIILTDVNPDLSEHKIWLNDLQLAWNNGKGYITTSELIKTSFKSSSNPYRTALYFLNHSSDFMSLTNATLGLNVMKTFQQWLQEKNNNNLTEKYQISSQSQIDAFDLIRNEDDFVLIKTVAEVYKLNEVGFKFVNDVKEIVKVGRYEQACVLASVLNIQKHFDINQFLVPLLLKDRLKFVEDYLDTCPDQRELFVRFLDNMCTDSDIKVDNISRNLKLNQSKIHYWTPKSYRKLCRRFLKLYNLPLDTCPNISQNDGINTLTFLVYDKKNTGRIGSEAWEEMIDVIVKNDVNLQVHLCLLLTQIKDLPSAAKYAVKYDVPKDKLNFRIKNEIEIRERNNFVENEIDKDEKEIGMYHSLALPFSSIIFVDDKHKFNSMLDALKDVDVIGCDCEGSPLKTHQVALLQIATPNQIFLIDPKVNTKETDLKVDDKQWTSLWTIFRNPEIKKIGFSFASEIGIISHCFPKCEALDKETKNILDLYTLCNKLADYHPEIFPNGPLNKRRRLANIVETCLGKKLDKREQLSNWENRPLRKKQIKYAAIDAFCLLEVYNVLKKRSEEFGIDLEHVMNYPDQKDKNNANPVNFSRSSEEFKVVVDSNLKGLDKELMLLGVDVKVEDSAELLRIGINEDRVIVSSTAPDKHVLKYVSRRKWFQVDESVPVQEAIQLIFSCYNIKVKFADSNK